MLHVRGQQDNVFEIMCFGYWRVAWGGGNCSVPCHGKRCCREAQEGSDTEVVLRFSAPVAAACTHSGRELSIGASKGFPS